jgi:hypothetical protein
MAVAHYSIIIKDINMKLRKLAYHEKIGLLDKWHNSESKFYFELCPFLTENYLTDKH